LITTAEPPVIHVFEYEAVAFEVTDIQAGGSLRGTYTGPYPGVVRPELDWTSDMSTLPAQHMHSAKETAYE
jgi:hypothetical protein